MNIMYSMLIVTQVEKELFPEEKKKKRRNKKKELKKSLKISRKRTAVLRYFWGFSVCDTAAVLFSFWRKYITLYHLNQCLALLWSISAFH
ncbi:MAG: hypothetical protein ACFFDH_23080 [Promethearchaeota archaeon]